MTDEEETAAVKVCALFLAEKRRRKNKKVLVKGMETRSAAVETQAKTLRRY